jgi:alpha-beta hydrolase superfamily lysophospholipase
MSSPLSPPPVTWLSAASDDGTRLRLARWGDGDRDALLVHGLAEHAGRYTHVAAAMVARGWRVTLVELRGHGESEGARGHTGRWRRYVEDLQTAASTVGRPLVMVAHSMGGAVALDALREPFTPAVRALALSNPALQSAVVAPAWKLKASGLLSKLLPALPLNNEIPTAHLSRDLSVVRAYEADPLVYPKITPRWFTELMAAQQRIFEHAPRYTVPMRLMVGTGDQICAPEGARRLAGAWTGPKDVVEYPGLYHELFNEPERQQVLDGLLDWMDARWSAA